MTKPKKATKKRKPKGEDEPLFAGKSDEEILGALLKVPRKKKGSKG